MSHVLASSDKASSYEKNNTKITEFGSVDLLRWSFLETQTFSKIDSICVSHWSGNLLWAAIHTFFVCSVHTGQWAFLEQCMNGHKRHTPQLLTREKKNDVSIKFGHRIKTTNNLIQWPWYHSFQKKIFYPMERKHILNAKYSDYLLFCVLETPNIGEEMGGGGGWGV